MKKNKAYMIKWLKRNVDESIFTDMYKWKTKDVREVYDFAENEQARAIIRSVIKNKGEKDDQMV